MPVDDDNINTLIEKTNVELGITGTRKSNLKQLLIFLQGIKKPIDPHDDTKTIMPTDIGIGGEMTTERRQTIYDKAIADAATLGL